MFEDWTPAALLVHLAALTYVIGFLIRDQLMLRGLVLVGTGFYIAYYYIVPEKPLWDAIAWSVVLGLANGFTMMRLLYDSKPVAFSDDDLVIFDAMNGIAPSHFRRIMKVAETRTAKVPTRLTIEDSLPHSLFFVLDGTISIGKIGYPDRKISGPTFIGEVGFLLKRAASATTTLQAGGRVVSWNVYELRELARKHDGCQVALDLALGRDLASKLANA